METADLQDRVTTRGHTPVCGRTSIGTTHSNVKVLPQLCSVECFQSFRGTNLCKESGEVWVHALMWCLDFPQCGSLLLCYKENYSKMKVTTKRLDWTGMPLQTIHYFYYPYLQLGIPTTAAQCNGSFSLRIPDVRERESLIQEKDWGIIFKMYCQLKSNSNSFAFYI